jgi:hypothetical protein
MTERSEGTMSIVTWRHTGLTSPADVGGASSSRAEGAGS